MALVLQSCHVQKQAMTPAMGSGWLDALPEF